MRKRSFAQFTGSRSIFHLLRAFFCPILHESSSVERGQNAAAVLGARRDERPRPALLRVYRVSKSLEKNVKLSEYVRKLTGRLADYLRGTPPGVISGLLLWVLAACLLAMPFIFVFCSPCGALINLTTPFGGPPRPLWAPLTDVASR